MGTRLFQFPVLPQMLIGWLLLLVLVALSLAAFFHWRLIRHWSLLVLAIAPLCCLLSYVAFRIGELPLRGATLDEIASGSRRAIQPLISAGGWLLLAGVACAGLGAVGSVYRALGLRRRQKTGEQNSTSVPAPPSVRHAARGAFPTICSEFSSLNRHTEEYCGYEFQAASAAALSGGSYDRLPMWYGAEPGTTQNVLDFLRFGSEEELCQHLGIDFARSGPATSDRH